MSSTQCASAFLSTTTVGVWMATVDGGMTIWSVSPLACAVSAAYSYVMATSPLPEVKFFSESFALLSCTVTFLKMPVRSFSASAGLFAA